jgi:hypothetical protein
MSYFELTDAELLDPKDFITIERQRQIEAEGYSPEHDDEHRDGELMDAGMCYFLYGTDRGAFRGDHVPVSWPWGDCWKPSTPWRNLVKAGALMRAEKDRLKRAGLSFSHVDHKLELVIAAMDRLPKSERA